MANIKSQKKRNWQNERRRERNKAVRTEVLLGRLDEQLAVVLTYILAQKIKPVLDMRNAGLLLREFQSTRAQKCRYKRTYFLLQLLL